MTQTIVNLTLPVVPHRVQEVLKNTPLKSSCSSTSSAVLEAQLIAYVMRCMPAFYVTANQPYRGAIDHLTDLFSPAQQQQIDALIDEGLQYLKARYSAWETAAQSVISGFGPSPSHWFG